MATVNIHEAKTRLSRLISEVERTGEPIIICRDGQPAARLMPLDTNPVDHFQHDPGLGGFLLEDPTAPLPPEAWPDPQP